SIVLSNATTFSVAIINPVYLKNNPPMFVQRSLDVTKLHNVSFKYFVIVVENVPFLVDNSTPRSQA
ncbi:hypothetical protein ACFLX4_02995, partial [Chloroflexota bacterium]